MQTFTFEQYRLMREHAGFSYRPGEDPEAARVRCAIDLARALHALERDTDISIDWEADDIDSSFFSDAIDDGGEPWPLYCCVMYSPRGDVLEALGGVDFGHEGTPYTDDYARVCEAEMYAELNARREACLVRGEN